MAAPLRASNLTGEAQCTCARARARAPTGLLLRIYLPLHTALSLGTVIVTHPSSHSKDALHCSPRTRTRRRPQTPRHGPVQQQPPPRSDNCGGALLHLRKTSARRRQLQSASLRTARRSQSASTISAGQYGDCGTMLRAV